MAPLTDDETVRRIDRVMKGAGFKKQRKHSTGKRLDKLPDLLLYSHEDREDFVTTGIEESRTDDGVRTTVQAKFGRTHARTWESLEDFENEAVAWIAERLAGS